MAKKIYISPSDQTENRYAWGNTNEHAQCQRIAEAEAAALRRSGVEVKLAAFGTTMAQRCAESDAWGADIHSCVHTNAFNGKVSGTRMFCYSVPGKGYDACRAVFGQLAPLTPGTSENIQANPRLYEVRNPAAPSVYCECEFHDSIQGARWIVEHTTDIGEAIAKGLCEYLGAAYVPARQEAPKPAEPAQGDTLYRVQVGAFAVRANAEKMLDRLKKAGFTGFVVEGTRQAPAAKQAEGLRLCRRPSASFIRPYTSAGWQGRPVCGAGPCFRPAPPSPADTAPGYTPAGARTGPYVPWIC